MRFYQSTTEFNCGIGLHARCMCVCVVDRQGNQLLHPDIQHNDFPFFLKTDLATIRHHDRMILDLEGQLLRATNVLPTSRRQIRSLPVSPTE